MDFQIKTFPGLERGNHVIAIIGGAVAVQGLNQIFNKVIDETRQLLDCKILIDFQDSILKILPSDILELVESIEPGFRSREIRGKKLGTVREVGWG